MNPIDLAFDLYQRIRSVFNRDAVHAADGDVIAYHAPGIMLLRPTADVGVKPKELLAVRDSANVVHVVLALDEVGHAEGNLWRAIKVPEAKESASAASAVALLPADTFVRLKPDAALSALPLVKQSSRLIGLVAENSSVQELYFDLIIGDGVEEGRLVCVNFNGRDVMYQIVNGLTRDEVVFQKATLGYVRAQARKVGSWDSIAHRFRHAKWIPPMNTPVSLEPWLTAFRAIHPPGALPEDAPAEAGAGEEGELPAESVEEPTEMEEAPPANPPVEEPENM